MSLPKENRSQSESPPAKRLKLTEAEDAQQETSPSSSSDTDVHLFDCCDDALLIKIFSYLKPTDLLSLSQCCERMQRVVRDRTLWTYVDFRPRRLSHDDLTKYVQFFAQGTTVIASRGPWVGEASPAEPYRSIMERCGECLGEDNSNGREYVPSITGSLLESIFDSAPNLKTLILENHIIDSHDVSWEMFPSSLRHLSLRSCHVMNIDPNRSFFFGIDRRLLNLKVLDVSDCLWFKTHSFFALSKCQSLEELRMADCRVGNFVPYVSLSTRFGFLSLTVVDFRRTWVSDREVSCLNKTSSLRELYLESPGGERGSRLISDLATTAFGGTLEDWNKIGYCVVIMDTFEGFKPSLLQVMTLCDYTAVTDTSLRHCGTCLKGLKQLNVKGTSCTLEGVIKFRSVRPDVQLESDFDVEVNPNPNLDNS